MNTLSKENCVANLWYSEFAEMWHWTIYFNPASHQEFHFNGNAPKEDAAKQDIVNTLAFIEQTYPTQEFFDAMTKPWTSEDIEL